MASGIRRSTFNVLATSALCAACSFAADAAINLDLRPLSTTARPGCTFRIGLYGVSDTSRNQVTSAVQAILNWDTNYVQLIGVDNTGAANWLTSGFLGEPYDLNTSLTDGDAMWIALAPLGSANSVPCTPAGTLLTTLRFQALTPTVPTTAITIASLDGNPQGRTIVYDGLIPNHDITGTLDQVSLTVSSCAGDANGNGQVNIDDLFIVINGWGPCPVAMPTCCNGDQNGTGQVNIDDLFIVINGWGQCP